MGTREAIHAGVKSDAKLQSRIQSTLIVLTISVNARAVMTARMFAQYRPGDA
jgi:hypothetical protein